MNQQTKHGLIWGGLLILLGAVSLVESFMDLNVWVWIATLVAGGLGAYAIYATDRTEKWILVVAYALLAIALLVSLLTLNALPGALIPTFVLLAIAFPFLIAFLQSDRTKWGLLIPVYILCAVGVMVPLIQAGILHGLFVAAYVLLTIAIPFFVAYTHNPKNWWVLIPGVVTGIVGFSFLIAKNAVEYVAPAVLIIVGILVIRRTMVPKVSD